MLAQPAAGFPCPACWSSTCKQVLALGFHPPPRAQNLTDSLGLLAVGEMPMRALLILLCVSQNDHKQMCVQRLKRR